MPLSEKARIEVYLPDLPTRGYQNLLEALDREFTYTFGGCTILRGLDGSYLSQVGLHVRDRINFIYTDTPFALTQHVRAVSRYAVAVRQAAYEALEEEAVLVAVIPVLHAEP